MVSSVGKHTKLDLGGEASEFEFEDFGYKLSCLFFFAKFNFPEFLNFFFEKEHCWSQSQTGPSIFTDQ